MTDAPRAASSYAMDAPITPAPTTATSQSRMHSHQCVYHLTQPEVLPSKDNEGPQGTIEISAGAKRPYFSPISTALGGYGACCYSGARSIPMEINRAAFGALAVFGVVAAGSGAYLASRHNEVADAAGDDVSGRHHERGDRDGKHHLHSASSGRRDRAGRGGRSRARACHGRPAWRARACAHGTSGIAARTLVVEFERQRVFSGADIYAVGHARRRHRVSGGRAAGKHDRRTRGRRPGTSAEAV